MKRIKFCLFLVFVFLFSFCGMVFGQTNSLNAGFVKGIWYSKTPFFAGENIRIYAAVQNRSGFDIIGKAQFYNSNKLIGESSFSALNGRLAEIWVDWVALGGQQSISAKIVEAKKSETGKTPESITLSNDSFPEDSIFVDIDTDKDKIGNQTDKDDDNDGLIDEDEKTLGTNSLEIDTDKDGQNDKEDGHPLVAETKFIENNLTNNSNNSLSPEKENIVEKVVDAYKKTEETALPIVKKIAGVINETADEQNEKIKARRQKLIAEMEAIEGNKTLKNVELFSLAFISFFLSNKILLYIALILLLFVFFKIIFKIIRQKHRR